MSTSAMSNSRVVPPAQPISQDTCTPSATEPLMRFLQNIAPRQSDPATSLPLPLSAADYAYAALLIQQSFNYNLSQQQNQQLQRPLHFNPYHMLHAPVTVHLPIHHTLENATIAYDTITEQTENRKHLVKDVFFSPAMTGDTSASSCCSQSDTDSEVRAEDGDSFFSPPITPSDLLLDDISDPLFFFGLDLAHSSASTTECEGNRATGYPNLPTPPAFVNDGDDEADPSSQLSGLLKRKHRSSEAVQTSKKKRDQWQLASPTSTPPASPAFDYFEDVSGEASSDEDDDSAAPAIKRSRDTGAKRAAAKALVKMNEDDDSSSVSSWEDCRASMFDDDEEEDLSDVNVKLETVQPRATALPTIYERLTKANVDWCRYCGTTEGVNWRPGPWGKRTLCNKHGCDYKGYGFACKLPRLDLTGFTRESIDDRKRPVLQLYCTECQGSESWKDNVLVRCEGCPKAFHQKCAPVEISADFVSGSEPWFCESACCDNSRRKRIVVELPRKRLPLMCAPKGATSPVELRTTRPLRDAR